MCPQGFCLCVLCYLSILVMQSGAVAPGALTSLWREGGERGGRSIGVTECSNRAYISSSLCPGQRVQQLHAVFSIPSPPPAPLSLFLPPSLSLTRSLNLPLPLPLSLSPGFPTVLFLSALEFHLPARGRHSRGHAVCVTVCARV